MDIRVRNSKSGPNCLTSRLALSTMAGLLILSYALCAGCASGLRLSIDDRVAVKRGLEGETVRLAVSLHVFDLLTAPAHFLVSPYPPDSIDLGRDPSGEARLPGPSIEILPLGTRVRIQEIAFPATLTAPRQADGLPAEAIRITFTRLNEGDPRHFMALLSTDISSRAELENQLSLLFSSGDPLSALARLGEEERAALMEKRLCPGMSPAVVALSWGRPTSIRIEWQQDVKVETWRWPLGRRAAVFRGDQLAETVSLEEETGHQMAGF